MKFKKAIVSFFFLAIINLVNCTGVNIINSVIFTPSTHPIDGHDSLGKFLYNGGFLYYKGNFPGQRSKDLVIDIKKGEACVSSYLYLYATGDSSIQSAKKNANIKNIYQVQYSVLAYGSFLYHKQCTIVYGE
jgi:hypothetical protein